MRQIGWASIGMLAEFRRRGTGLFLGEQEPDLADLLARVAGEPEAARRRVGLSAASDT